MTRIFTDRQRSITVLSVFDDGFLIGSDFEHDEHLVIVIHAGGGIGRYLGQYRIHNSLGAALAIAANAISQALGTVFMLLLVRDMQDSVGRADEDITFLQLD